VDVAAVRPYPRQALVTRLTNHVQRQGQVVGHEDGPRLDQPRLVLLAAVVEPGRDVDLEGDPSPHASHHPQDPVVRGGLLAGRRHEVDHLADSVLGHEPGDQDGGVRKVQLPAGDAGAGRPHPEVAAAFLVEQRGEDTRRVEPWAAEPVDGTVDGHQRGGLQVADQSVVGNGWVLGHQGLSPVR
jgi:hypothetical protein